MMQPANAVEPRKGPGSSGGQLQRACTAGGHAVWMVYRTFLSGTVSQVVPEATRDALFQLFCDIRANVPKDKRFLRRHVKAFEPRSVVGWLALSGILGYCLSAALLLSTLTLGISVAGLFMAIAAIVAFGTFIATSLGFLAFVLFVSAFAVGTVAFATLSAYAVTTSSVAVTRSITNLVFGGSTPPKITLGPAHQSPHPILVSEKEGSDDADLTAAVDGQLEAETTAAAEENISEAQNHKDSKQQPLEANEKEQTGHNPSTYASPVPVLPPIKTSTPKKNLGTANHNPSPKVIAVRLSGKGEEIYTKVEEVVTGRDEGVHTHTAGLQLLEKSKIIGGDGGSSPGRTSPVAVGAVSVGNETSGVVKPSDLVPLSFGTAASFSGPTSSTPSPPPPSRSPLVADAQMSCSVDDTTTNTSALESASSLGTSDSFSDVSGATSSVGQDEVNAGKKKKKNKPRKKKKKGGAASV